MDFYHSPVAVWVNSAPQPKRWGPRAHRGIIFLSVNPVRLLSQNIPDKLSQCHTCWCFGSLYHQDFSSITPNTSWMVLMRYFFLEVPLFNTYDTRTWSTSRYQLQNHTKVSSIPDSKVHGPHVGLINFAFWVYFGDQTAIKKTTNTLTIVLC